jgi:PilZ domain
MHVTPDLAAATPQHQERRRETRYPFDAGLEIEWGSSTLAGRVKDISVSGIFFSLSEPLWLGASFAATVLLDPPINVHCVVERVEPGRGIAAKLVIPDPESKDRIAALIQGLERER